MMRSLMDVNGKSTWPWPILRQPAVKGWRNLVYICIALDSIETQTFQGDEEPPTLLRRESIREGGHEKQVYLVQSWELV